MNTGFNAVIGSCNTIAILEPLTDCISLSDLFNKFSPSKFTSPPTINPGGDGISCIIDKEVTDFPEPDSPTTAKVSPFFKSKLTPSTALTKPHLV